MRSTNDAIQGLRKRILEWDIFTEEDLKELEKEARSEVDRDVAEAEASPVPDNTRRILYEDIYARGSEPESMRGRTAEETFYYKE